MANKSWIQTLDGRQLEPLSITPGMVGSIDEIAHALAHEYRFTRQTATPYSVAEHCVRGSRFLPPVLAGAFLLHELSEVYLPDIAGPLKDSVFVRLPGDEGFTPWTHLERQHTHAILEALDLLYLEPLIYSPEVKRMDLEMLAWEKRDLMGPEPAPWGLPFGPASEETLIPWTESKAFEQFLSTYDSLFKVRK